MNCIVVIPIYKASLTKIEELSFRQCLKVLKAHNIAIVGPQTLDYTYYDRIADEEGKAISIERFDDCFFKSVSAYNSLCLNEDFYQRFCNYAYMLIYQTDAWVFRDDLSYWCEKGYDYIGAPLYYRKNGQPTKELIGVGNGGFSLRRIDYCIDILTMKNQKRPFLSPIGVLRHLKLDSRGRLRDFLRFCYECVGINNNIAFYKKALINEDLIFGIFAKNAWINSNIPDFEEAAKFAFEANPQYLYHHIGDKLPFGCHAFEKFEFDSFWRRYITLE